MGVFSKMPTIPSMRPGFNIGAMLDIISGTYYLGRHGESILNSGLFHIVSLAGPGNSFKSAIIIYINMIIAERIKQYQCSIYDSEDSMSYGRLIQLSKKLTRMSQVPHGSEELSPDEVKFIITSGADILGDIYFDNVIDIATSRIKDKVKPLITPFITPTGKPISILTPVGIMIDSLSEFKVTANQENIVDKNSIGDAENNILYMRDGIAKKQMIQQLPNLCVNGGLYVTMTAHIGDEFEIGGRFAVKKHKLTHAKKGSKVTGTTKAFEFINSLLFEIFDVSLLNNKEHNTGVLYPALTSDRVPGCVDLLKVQLKLTRNKNGPSGSMVDLIVSQREGVLPHLSMFHFLKELSKVGYDGLFEGGNTSYSLAMLPDVKLSRTTVRTLIDESTKLQRALEIASELMQIKTLWAELPNNLMCTPAQLYQDIKSLGYDWDILLNTRGYWVFIENENEELPYLSTMDLLRMRAQLYRPYFLNEDLTINYDNSGCLCP